jgi:hypothetical protein
MSDLFNREPDFTVTTDDLTASGDLVDLRDFEVTVWIDRDVTGDHNAQQVTHVSKALWSALNPERWSHGRDGLFGANLWAVFEAMLRFLTECATDTAEEGEPSGQLLETPQLRGLGPARTGPNGRAVWFQRNGQDTWTAMFPSDY